MAAVPKPLPHRRRLQAGARRADICLMSEVSAARVALFIDFENLAYRLQEPPPGHARTDLYDALEGLCRREGDVVVRRAYADWSSPAAGNGQAELVSHGIEPVQVARFGGQQKNAVDIRLALDALE